MVGCPGQRHELAMTVHMCTAAFAHARSAWRRRGMSNKQGLGSVDVDELPHHYPEFLGRYVKHDAGSPSAPERDDSPKAMFRKMDGAAVGSGAGAGAGAAVQPVLADGDACSSSLTRSYRPPAKVNQQRPKLPLPSSHLPGYHDNEPRQEHDKSYRPQTNHSTQPEADHCAAGARSPAAITGQLRSTLSTTRTVAVVPHRAGGSQVAAVVRKVALPLDGRERRPGEPRLCKLYGTPPTALEVKRRESQGQLMLEAPGRQESVRQAAAIAAARGRAMEGGRCGSPQVFRAGTGKLSAELCGIAVRRAALTQAGGARAALWPEVQARADELAPQILQELTDAAQQPSRPSSPLAPVTWQVLSQKQIDADVLRIACLAQKLAEIYGESSGAQPELPALSETTALPETSASCPYLINTRIKSAQPFEWPRSFSGRLLGGAVQLHTIARS